MRALGRSRNGQQSTRERASSQVAYHAFATPTPGYHLVTLSRCPEWADDMPGDRDRQWMVGTGCGRAGAAGRTTSRAEPLTEKTIRRNGAGKQHKGAGE